MKLLKILFISIASLILTSCASTNVSSTSSPNENLLTKCPRIEAKAPETFGETMQQLNDLTDMYTDCRIRHNGLVEYERKRK